MSGQRRGPRPTRREFLATAAAGTVGIGMGDGLWDRRDTGLGASPDPGPRVAPLKLGVASYSLRELSRSQAIEAILALRVRYVNVKSFHLPYEATTDELTKGREEFEGAGVRIVGGGTVTLTVDTDDDVRTYFEYARACGMPLMVIAPTRLTLPRIERFVQEYDIAVAIHNHGPEDRHFPGPQDALPVIRDMDPRVGVCLDVGHTARTGIDVVEAALMCGDRLLDLHMKDLADLSRRESQCIVGEGAVPVARLFEALVDMRYPGHVNLEYEIDPSDPLPGMLRSFAFMRGVLAGLDP